MKEQTIDQHWLSDALLVDQICAGDDRAFESLVGRYQNRLSHFVHTYLVGEDAQDVLQFVWMQLYLHIQSLQAAQTPARRAQQESLRPWLFRIARNRCIDEQRKRKRRAFLFSEVEPVGGDDELSVLSILPDPAPQPDECAEQSEVRQQYLGAVQELPPKFRNVVWLRYEKELSYDEIGQQLHIPPTTAKTYCLRGRMRLRRMLLF